MIHPLINYYSQQMMRIATRKYQGKVLHSNYNNKVQCKLTLKLKQKSVLSCTYFKRRGGDFSETLVRYLIQGLCTTHYFGLVAFYTFALPCWITRPVSKKRRPKCHD